MALRHIREGVSVTIDGALPMRDSLGRQELLRVLTRGGDEDGLVDALTVSIATEIIEGRLKPGDDLNSVELARSFSCSRTPVREALFALQREGFVEIPPRRRPRVAQFTIQEVRELYELRAILYGAVSRGVVARATEDDLERLRGHLASLEHATRRNDVDSYFWINVQFRNCEASITGNATLHRMLDSLGLRVLQLRHLSLSKPGRLARSFADHERLVRAYEDRDAELAVALTRSLVKRGLATIERSGWTGAGN
jgi:DNA-binding GntR family transcriptional regulator